jgi:hypothetical protein
MSNCSTCAFWYCGPGREAYATYRGQRRECHVNAPSVMYRPDASSTLVTIFPGTHEDDSCGQWEPIDA